MYQPPRVSFDFDGTLEREFVQQYCAELMGRGLDVWVVTTRYDDKLSMELFQDPQRNQDFWPIVDRLGIPYTNIVFTNFCWKAVWFSEGERRSKFLWHLDDNPDDLRRLSHFDRSRPSTLVPISVLTENWRGKCDKLIKAELRRRELGAPSQPVSPVLP